MNFPALKTALLSAATALLLASCQKDVAAPGGSTTAPRPLSTAERQTLTSANDFAYRAFGTLRQADPADNIFISPLSISAALTMAYNGADGSTKAVMKQTLGFQPLTDQQINASYQSLVALLSGLDPRVQFTAANSIWHAQGLALAAPFVQTNQTYFNATVQGVPFGNPAAATAINNWVSANTQGKIPTILNQTNPDDVLYIVNAIYFKGAWTYRFDPQQTRPAPFYRANGNRANVDFMTLANAPYRHYQDARQEVVDLPYGNGQFSMTFVMPQDTSSLAGLATRLSGSQLDAWLAAADSTKMELHVPRFKLEYEKTLNDMLTTMGMGEAFGSGANFTQMLASGASGLAISEVKHKTYLDVNEEGTEAAAVTSVGVVNTSVPPSVSLNRPFIFLIREKSSGAILFMGQLVNP